MQILQVIKRQSTVRTFQEIYSYWKGNKCLTWNGYNENFDSVSQQEILSLKTSLVSIFPSSFENCHSGYSSHFYFILFPSLFFLSWKWSLVMRTVLLSRCLLAVFSRVATRTFHELKFHSYFNFNFHVVIEKSVGLDKECLSSYLFSEASSWWEYAYKLFSHRQRYPPPDVFLTT